MPDVRSGQPRDEDIVTKGISFAVEFNGHPDAAQSCGSCGEPTNRLKYIAIVVESDHGSRSQLCEECAKAYGSLGYIADGLDLIFRGLTTSRLSTRLYEAEEVHRWIRMLMKSLNACPVEAGYRGPDEMAEMIAKTAAAMPFVGA